MALEDAVRPLDMEVPVVLKVEVLLSWRRRRSFSSSRRKPSRNLDDVRLYRIGLAAELAKNSTRAAFRKLQEGGGHGTEEDKIAIELDHKSLVSFCINIRFYLLFLNN